jgi:outer membrane protein assembly factor BamB
MERDTHGVAGSAVADWPSSNGDVANSRHAAGEVAITVASVGSLSPHFVLTTGGSNWSTPVVVGDSIYLTDASGALTRADRETGRVAWSRQLSDYHGIDKAVARASVVVAGDLVIVGDRTGHVIGVERESGERRWMTRLDEHPGAMVTGSPILHGTTLFVGVSSLEGMKVMQDRSFRSTFIGSMLALDITDGRIVWKTPTMPTSGGWAGGAVISVPAHDAATGTVY